MAFNYLKRCGSTYYARMAVPTDLSPYSPRHGFADAMRRADYPDEQLGFFMGHSRFSMTNRYGQLPQGMLRTRAEMIEKVEYPGLRLSISVV